MKRLLATVLGVALAATAAAQTAPQGTKPGTTNPGTNPGATSPSTLPPVQPPPDMDAPAPAPAPASAPAPAPRSDAPLTPLGNSDAEAQAAAAAEAQATTERAKALASPDFTKTPEPPKLESPGLPDDVQKAAEATELPVITVRQNGNERVEEYRKRGVLYFVRVVPQEGPPRYYVDRPSNVPRDLSAISGPSGVVQPVYYKLFEWH
jgi:hypothetical protein